MSLKAVSLNTRGFNESIKRRKLFRWLYLCKFDIIFLQETYSDPGLEEFWRTEWGGEILFAHGSKHSKGVMILFKPSLSVVVLKTTVDKNGRFLVANVNINEDELCSVNIYALMTKTSKSIFSVRSSIRSVVILPARSW